MEPDFRHAEGLAEPRCHTVTNSGFYLEYLSPDNKDTIYHLFAVPGRVGPWAPPDGNKWVRTSLAVFKEKASLPYSDDETWCSAQWDSEGVPEYVHFAVRQVDDLVASWLLSLGIEPARTTAGEMLRKMQDILFPKHTFFHGRLALLDRLRSETLRDVLANLEQPVPEGPDIDDKIREVLDILVPMSPGVWSIAFRELQDRVMNHAALAESFLSSLG